MLEVENHFRNTFCLLSRILCPYLVIFTMMYLVVPPIDITPHSPSALPDPNIDPGIPPSTKCHITLSVKLYLPLFHFRFSSHLSSHVFTKLPPHGEHLLFQFAYLALSNPFLSHNLLSGTYYISHTYSLEIPTYS